MSEPRHPFYELWAEVEDLERVEAILGWDQETGMPQKGQAARGHALATIAGLRHARTTSSALSDALASLEEQAEPGSDDAAQAAAARREVERATRIPAELAKRKAEVSSRALATWQRARRAGDFSAFQADLEQQVGIAREIGEHLAPLAPTGRVYDALLDEYEPGATEAELVPLFGSLRASLAPIVQAVAESGVEVDESPARGRFPRDAQRELALRAAARIGFDLEAGRLDAAAHPFCSGFDPSDVRLTWRWDETDFRPALFGVLHEAGHGLYEQGLPARWSRTPLGHAVSLGVHESQSRLWENLVGRSRAFWTWALPELRALFPDARGVDVDALHPALHTVRPSLIRVEADETTYNLHVVARFELERALFSGELAVRDLPGAWDDAYASLLGVRAPGPAEGVLQDIHWAMGAFGYFPTYALGNLLAAQLFASARAALGDLDDAMARGDFAPLLAWLRENVHGLGRRASAGELVRRATGRPLAADDFLAHVRANAADVYGVAV